jgi:phosphate transport system permease protein
MSEPTKPHDDKKQPPKTPTQPGLGKVIGTAGGLPVSDPPDTSALHSQTLEALTLAQLEAAHQAEAALQPGLGHAMAVAGGVAPAMPPETAPAPPREPPDLELRLRKPRTLFSAAMSLIVGVMSVIAMVPLVSVLVMLIWHGGQKLSAHLFTDLPPAAGMSGGGIGNALAGTILIVGIATLISVPFGILAALLLAEFAPKSVAASVVRFTAKVLTGLPSVLAGLFAYAAVVIGLPPLVRFLSGGHLLFPTTYSAPAGGIALAILMLPTIMLTAEEAIKMVPQRMREAAIGMGCTQTQVVWLVVLPTALPGILTGVMLAVARAAGETAPLLFTALFSNYWLTRNPMEPTPSLAVLIFNFSSSPFRNQIEIAWAASLVLVFLVLLANVAAQIWTGRSTTK